MYWKRSELRWGWSPNQIRLIMGPIEVSRPTLTQIYEQFIQFLHTLVRCLQILHQTFGTFFLIPTGKTIQKAWCRDNTFYSMGPTAAGQLKAGQIRFGRALRLKVGVVIVTSDSLLGETCTWAGGSIIWNCSQRSGMFLLRPFKCLNWTRNMPWGQLRS